MSEKSNKSVHPLLFVAFGAIFLFTFLSLRTAQTKIDPLFLASNAQSSSPKEEISSKSVIAPETPDLVFVGKTGILASTPPQSVTPKVLGAIVGQVDTDVQSNITQYVVEQGDTPASIAQKFGVSLNTILWANNLKESSSLVPGKELTILPVSGVLHIVRSGDTLSEISSWYKVPVSDIVQFNNLSETQVFVGDILVIPNGIMPKVLPQGRLTPLPNSYFIWPIPAPHRITQGLHPFNAVDMANGSCGNPIYAAAGGEVQKTGYTWLGGNYVRILHSNGVVTYYGHMSASIVSAGAKIYQGQIIGYVGHTGITIPAGPSGCHVHFEVRGAVNPFAQ